MADDIVDAYQKANTRLLLFDYDGTLTPIKPTPPEAVPTRALLALLEKLASDSRNKVVIISGRDHSTLDTWLGHLPMDLAAEHGLFVKHSGRQWRALHHVDSSWKETVRPVLDMYVQQVPGSFIEEKALSLAWHYRAVNEHLAAIVAPELVRQLHPEAAAHDLIILQGSKVLEVKPRAFSKGTVARHWLEAGQWDFMLAAGDDTTDEDLFAAMPRQAYTIKIGPGQTAARLRLVSPQALRALLRSLT